MNTECCISEVMATSNVPGSVSTDLTRVKERLEELYKFYDIDLLPLWKCVLGVHLVEEFAEQAMLQDEREFSLISSLCLWKTRTVAGIKTYPISTNSVSMGDKSVMRIKTKGTPNRNSY